MRTRAFFLIAMIVSGVLGACKGTPISATMDPANAYTRTNGMVVNGGPYNQKSFNLPGDTVSLLRFNVPNMYVITLLSMPDSILVQLFVPDTLTGTKAWVDQSFSATSLVPNTASVVFGFAQWDSIPAKNAYISGTGSTVITRFGAYGDSVAGSFSGTLKRADGSPINVNGKFTALRYD